MDIKIGSKKKKNHIIIHCTYVSLNDLNGRNESESSNLINSKLSTRNFVARSKRPKKRQAENSISPRCFAVKLFTGRVNDARIN